MPQTRINATFTQVIYSPHGGVEGFLVRAGKDDVQFVLDKDDEDAARLVGSLVAGQQLVVSGEALPPSRKGPGAHAVHSFGKLVSVDGAVPRKIKASDGYSGAIARFNYARHGAPNGYVLDTGDFIHVKPDGFAKLKLELGHRITAEGDAHFLATGSGWAVEATTVNGKKLK